MSNFATFELNPNSIWLEISPKIQEDAMAQAESLNSSQAEHCTYLNTLCQAVTLPYFQEYDADAYFAASNSDFWALEVNGCAITLCNHRFVLLPSDAIDLEEIRIPREWVDCAELAADFYLAVQISEEDGMARIWGYTTHDRLKKRGQYCSRDRSYVLAQDDVEENINSLWLLQTHFPDQIGRAPIPPIPTLSLDRLTQVLDKLAIPDLIFPRRAVEFEEWVAVLANSTWRQMLLERRTAKVEMHSKSGMVQLRDWLEHHFEEGWQGIQQVINPQLIGSFMGAQVKRAKLIDLGLNLSGHQLALMISVGEAEQGVSVQASVYPAGEALSLPPHLKLAILTETGTVFKEITSRSDDEFIQYKFDAEMGDQFSVRVNLDEAIVMEQFQV
jgi:hypothetical protein